MRSTLYLLLLILLFGIHKSTYGQINLVPNHSFENYSVCPQNSSWSVATYVDDWLEAQTTCDYFNACGTLNDAQLARTGGGYAGLSVYRPGWPSVGPEHIQVKLNSPLVAGTEYQLEFYVLLSASKCVATWSIGGLFTNTQQNWSWMTSLPTPQVENGVGNFLTSKTTWTPVTGTFIAVGGEEYLTIGNMNPEDTSLFTNLCTPGGVHHSYYLIDDVSVTEAAGPLPDTVAICDGDTLFVQNYAYTTTGLYEDTIKNSSGGDSLSIVQLEIMPRPLLAQVADTTVCEFIELPPISGIGLSGNEAYFTASTASGESFNIGDTIDNSMLTYIFDSIGVCNHEVSFNITIDSCIAADPFAIPNIITPNEDGFNDRFKITGSISPPSLVIYNRWGRLVYESNYYKNSWDAEGLPDGVYHYRVLWLETDTSYKGWVQVLR